MSLLAEPQAPALEQVDEPRPRRRRAWVLAGVGLVAGLWLLAPYLVRVAPPQVALGPEDGLMIEGYGAAGTYAMHYRYGEEVVLSVPVANDSPVPIHVTGVQLVEPSYPLLEPVDTDIDPFTLLPGTDGSVDLTFEFTNCRYYHERANNTFEQVRVTGTVLGRDVTRTVDLAVPLMVHSQVIINCPERTFVRGDDRRV